MLNTMVNTTDGILGVPRGIAEVPELELDGGHLRGGGVGAPLGLGRNHGGKVDIAEGHA